MENSLAKLRHFVAVAKTQNLSRAAELLRISQPALSKTIASIEQAHGVRLFDRSRAGMQLTEAGAQILDDAERLLRDARTLDHNLKMLGQGKTGTIVLGVGPAVATLFLAKLASSILSPSLNITLSTKIRPLEALLFELMNEEMELLVAAKGGVAIPPDLEVQEIGAINSAFYVRKGHTLAGKKSLCLNEIAEYPIACPMDPVWLPNHKHKSNLFICDNYRVIYEFMLLNDAICLCPAQFATFNIESERVTMLNVTDWKSQRVPIIAAWIKGRTLSPIARQVVATCQVYFSNI